MNDGMTVGELRQLLSTQELLDLLEKLHIDTGTFGQILTIINKMPSVADSVRVSFGTPNHAGLYTVTAVTDSKNYETGVGIGTLLVKMRSKGVKLNWNERFVNGKITAEEAKNACEKLKKDLPGSLIRKLDIKIRYYMRLRDDRDEG